MTETHTAQALFASTLQPSDGFSAEHVAAAVRDSLGRHGGYAGCAAVCATEYGDHPESARVRMRWAIALTARIGQTLSVAA